MESVLDLQHVSKRFRLGKQRIQALNDVSLKAIAGEMVAIMGASGSGKSTLLHLIGGLDLPDSGQILIGGKDLARMSDRQRTLFRRRRMGIIFQTFNLLPTLSARENVAVPLLVDGQSVGSIKSRVDEILDLVHLGNRAEHRPQAMSGGEQQRVAIARALLNDPAVILADEPTGNLDSHNAVEIWELLSRLAREMKKTVIMVTHEAIAASYADVIHVLKDGEIIGTIDEVERGNASLVAARYTELAD